MAKSSQRARLAIDLPADIRVRARVAAARRDMTLQEYVRRALDRQLEEDGRETLHAAEDPVLAEIWSDPENDAYDVLNAGR